MAKVIFIPAGDIANAGSRMRCYWPARHMPEARVVSWDEVRESGLPDDADAYVFQKLVDVSLMRALIGAGKLVFWDVCDPAWWWSAAEAREADEWATAVVASNVMLEKDYQAWALRPSGTHTISDRLDLAHFDRVKQHHAADPVRLIWFGAAQNRAALYAAHANLSRLQANGLRIALTICDDHPERPFYDIEGAFPVYYTRWSLAGEVETLTAHDIALLPLYPGPWGTVKSINKRLTAWACGLPTATGEGYETLRGLVTDAGYRRNEGAAGRREVEKYWQAERSADEWQALVAFYQRSAEEAKHG